VRRNIDTGAIMDNMGNLTFRKNADFLATKILEFSQKSRLNHLNKISQSHKHLDVQAKIKEKFPTMIFTHYMTNQLKLVIVDIICKYNIMVFI